MKTLVLTLVFLLLVRYNFAGCRSPYLSTSNGIYYSEYDGFDQSVEVKHPDSLFQISIIGQLFCTSVYDVKVYLNGNLIYDNPDEILRRNLSLPELPGSYIVTCNSASNMITSNGYWQFTLTPKPPDTTATPVIPPKKILNPDFLMYPNPANDNVTFSNETDTIKAISFFTAIGKLYFKLELKEATVTVPLTTFPGGIYFIQVATLSDKVFIRKLLVR